MLCGIPFIFFTLERQIDGVERRQLFFDIVICAMTLLGAVNYSVLAWQHYSSDFDVDTLPLQARGVIERVHRGQIPPP